MREKRQLIEFAKKHLDEILTLVTVTETEGSTYRKAGAQKLISSSGESVGLISGGCLEREIVQFALEMKDQEATQLIDSTGEGDRLYGYSLGCQGKLFLRFEQIAARELLDQSHFGLNEHEKLDVFVFGLGPDIDPLHELLKWSQWEVSYFSSRKDLVDERNKQGWKANLIELNKIKLDISNPLRSALLFMSHDYNFDLEVLSSLYHPLIKYIGILGPEKKKEILLKDLKKVHSVNISHDNNFYGPMGLDGMGRGESAIALSIVSQLQAIFFGSEQ